MQMLLTTLGAPPSHFIDVFISSLRNVKEVDKKIKVRKFNPGVDERSRLQLSYLGDELTAQKLKDFVEKHNAAHS